MPLLAAIALSQIVAVSAGQLARAPDRPGKLSDDEGEAAKPATKAPTRLSDDDEGLKPALVPPPIPLLPVVPFLITPVPAPPIADRVRTSDGRVHVGKILREIDNGLEFEDEAGVSYPIALSVIVAVERAEKVWNAPAPRPPQVDADATRKALGLAFDVWSLEQERARLTWGEKALVCGLGVVATVVGFAFVKGDTGKAVGIIGAVGAGAGGVALGVNAMRSLSLSRRADEARAQLEALGKPAPVARGHTVSLPAVAVAF
jgi:hypothetical protein